jgi:ketosteroid isomerase-like protein
MFLTANERFECLDSLFGSFARGDYNKFLAGCTDDLVLNVRGSAKQATMVPALQVPQWHRSTGQLTGGSFHTSVCFVLVTDHACIVVLTHLVDRDCVSFRYETVNHCTLRDDLLASWFSYPMDAADYAEAWDLPRTADPQFAS